MRDTGRYRHSMLEQSWREEELRQFVGRLRPVFRNIDDDLPPPVWVACGKILPDDTIVDDLLEMKSLLKSWPLARLVRLDGGVLADNVSPHIPGGQETLRGRTLAELAKELPRALPFLRRWAIPACPLPRRFGSCREGSVCHAVARLDQWRAVSYWLALSERHGEPRIL